MIVLFSQLSNAQRKPYAILWKEVEAMEIKGLPKSALKIVEQIETKAKKDNNTPQQIKVMLFKSKFALILKEDAQISIINHFKSEINQATFPKKNILESILANLYWQYFQQNRWKFYNRTQTAQKVDTEDFRTWDLQTIFNQIQLHYANSLQNALEAQQIPISQFNDILIEQPNAQKYRPTLYDFLAHEALSFYKTDETSITRPAYKFELDNPQYLAVAPEFSKLFITSKDSTSLQLQALKTYQNLIKFHSNDSAPEALTVLNIDRLNFVFNNAVFQEKEEQLLQTLANEKKTIASHPMSGLYSFEMASIYSRQAEKYTADKPETELFQWKKKEALQLCDEVINTFPESLGAQKCEVLKAAILQPSLSLTTEKYVPVQSHARILIRYKNVNNLYFSAFQLSQKQLEKFNKLYRKEKKQTFLDQLDVVTSWEAILKNEGDFQQHSTEALLPPLKNGTYLIVASNSKTVSVIDTHYAYTSIQVTDWALTGFQDQDKHYYQVINRNTGNPAVGASVAMHYKKNYNSPKKTQHYTTDKNGIFILNKDRSSSYYNVDFIIKHQDQTAYYSDYYSNSYYYNRNEKLPKIKPFIFTDRSIYRPGQTVYFKAIVLRSEVGKSSVIPNKKVFATLYNVNDEDISELELTTNEFGSVAGEFILPAGGLTGEFYIDLDSDDLDFDTTGDTYFSVEEYKRPTFETQFIPVTETVKINDSITVKGEAIAYSGSTVSQAKVVYRVKRNIQFPRWYYWYRPWYNSEPQEITHGEIRTNDKGEFEITFKALPDPSVDKKNLPVFTYEIIADVTDINGETRSSTTLVKVGYHSLVATITVPAKINKTEKEHLLQLTTQNLNGEFVPASGKVTVYKLIPPQRVLRKRPWSAPDYQAFSREDFERLFPHDAYTNENEMVHWKKSKPVFSTRFNTKDGKEINLSNIRKWQSGSYVIELTTQDKFGQEVKDIAYTLLYSPNDKKVPDNQLFTVTANQHSFQAGEKVALTIGSAAKDMTVTLMVEKNHIISSTQIIRLNNNKKTIFIPVTQEDLGGFIIHYSFSAFNAFTPGSLNINVPYPKTQLQIETQTFRDKLVPGQEETWSFTIKGPKGEKVSSELLASMYDASLDQFKPHSWNFNPIYQPTYYTHNYISSNSFGVSNFSVFLQRSKAVHFTPIQYNQLNWFGFYFGKGYGNGVAREMYSITKKFKNSESEPEMLEVDAVMVEEKIESTDRLLAGQSAGVTIDKESNKETALEPNFDEIIIRKNLQETAFFFPQLQTDKDGNIRFSFTTPEALTRWKFQLLAHTKNAESTVAQFTTVTQKELMVTPNLPRFFREGDTITLSSKISNISTQDLFGEAKIILLDALTNKDITQEILVGANFEVFKEKEATFPFTLPAEKNTAVSWDIFIPEKYGAITCKIIAKAGDFSDGEQRTLPVLSNRMLVTETLPMWIRSNQTKTFTLTKLKDNTSTTLKNHKLTLEITSNPAWYAVQALPYLMEYPYECNEQTFSRYYANALATHIANSNPRIQEVFNRWKNTDALLSNLEKNQELKSLLIQETPWLRDAQSETEQKKRIALLFDLNKMKNELTVTQQKLMQNQLSNGGWAWFKGGRDNRYITQHIITGFGHLKQLGVFSTSTKNKGIFEAYPDSSIKKAIKYLDDAFVKEYNDLKKYNKDVDYSKDHLSFTQLHYLYMRSFFPNIKKSKQVQRISQYYLSQINTYWLSRSLYAKGLMTLIVHRAGKDKTALEILLSLKENSITSKELGMYWKANTASWYWYQAPIETQALLIEAFSEVGNSLQTKEKNLNDIDNLKVWLLKNKQTNRWKTTKATTEAVYALFLQGSDWLSISEMVEVVVGTKKIDPGKLENTQVEAGTGYFKTSWNTTEITPEMAQVTLTKKGKGIAWGALYWQYFENLDKITSAKTPLQLSKKLFIKKNTDTGEMLTEITPDTPVKTGDLVRVRIELKVDRPMEFVHLKDMRAAGFEPVNVLSSYKWQDGLGYYESTQDAATHFFFDYLPKGVYVFEYDLRANNAGNFSNGISTIQSMYAPEFSSHSEGIRVKIE